MSSEKRWIRRCPFEREVPPLQLIFEAELLQAPQGMHDPVVLFDEPGIDGLIPGRHCDQVGEVRRIVEEHQAIAMRGLSSRTGASSRRTRAEP